MWKVSGIKIEGTQGRYFFFGYGHWIGHWTLDKKISEKRTQDSENLYERGVQNCFDPVLVDQSWVSAIDRGPLAEI